MLRLQLFLLARAHCALAVLGAGAPAAALACERHFVTHPRARLHLPPYEALSPSAAGRPGRLQQGARGRFAPQLPPPSISLYLFLRPAGPQPHWLSSSLRSCGVISPVSTPPSRTPNWREGARFRCCRSPPDSEKFFPVGGATALPSSRARRVDSSFGHQNDLMNDRGLSRARTGTRFLGSGMALKSPWDGSL